MSTSLQIPRHFQPFAFLIGEWVGTFADGTTTDHQFFEWLHDGKAIRNHHFSTGERPHSGDAVYVFDAQAAQILSWYWDVTGGISSGVFTVNGDELHAEEEYRGAQSYRMRSIWKPAGANEYHAQQFGWQAGEWAPLWTVIYRRTINPKEKK